MGLPSGSFLSVGLLTGLVRLYGDKFLGRVSKYTCDTEIFLEKGLFSDSFQAILVDMLNGFKDFISRGNVIDLAVGVIIGGAFGKVVTALVESVMMPAIARVVGEPNFDNWLAFGDIKIGVLLTAVINFLIVAAALYFCIVLPINKMNERRAAKLAVEEEVEDEDPQVALLKEIRDSLVAGK